MKIVLNKTAKIDSDRIKLSDLLIMDKGYIKFIFDDFGFIEFSVERTGVKYGKEIKD